MKPRLVLCFCPLWALSLLIFVVSGLCAYAQPPVRQPESGPVAALHQALTARDYATMERLHSEGVSLDTYRTSRVFQSQMRYRSDTNRATGQVKVVKTFVHDSSERKTTPLLEAAFSGDHRLANWLIARKANPNLTNERGQTPLELALRKDDTQMQRILLAAKADIERLPEKGFELLRFAVKRDSLDYVKYLVAYNLPIKTKDSLGFTITHYAVGTQDISLIRILLDAGAPLDDGDNEGNTPLHRALTHGNEDAALVLLKRGANPFKGNLRGQTALHIASGNQKSKVAQELFNYQASAKETDDFGNTPLHYAAQVGNAELVKLMLDRGAAINAVNKGGTTPLIFAAQAGKAEAVKLLLTRGAAKNSTDSLGVTPLIAAAASGDAATLKLFLAEGSPVNIKTRGLPDYPDGLTPLQFAVLANGVEAVRMLVKAGAQLNQPATSAHGNLLHFAANGSGVNSALLRELVKLGLKVASTDDNGETPLHIAVLRDNVPAVLALMELGASATIANKGGSTPRSLAKSEAVRQILGQ